MHAREIKSKPVIVAHLPSVYQLLLSTSTVSMSWSVSSKLCTGHIRNLVAFLEGHCSLNGQLG